MIKEPEQDRIRRVLTRLRKEPSNHDLRPLQINEALLWAANERLLNDATAQEQRILFAMEARQRAYWATVQLLAKTLPELGVPYVFIKAFRAHPYVNTDVNVIVHPVDYNYVVETFAQMGWSTRSAVARTKEWLAERGKRKLLPPKGEIFAEIHLYPCATWHGLTYLSNEWMFQHSLTESWHGVEVVNTDQLADLLVHYGHCAFERYNLTFGELYHIQTIRYKLGIDNLERAKTIAQEWGWDKAFALVDRVVSAWWEGNDSVLPPVRLPRSDLRRCWWSRSYYHLRRRQLWEAIEEAVHHQLWASPLYDLYRLAKHFFKNAPDRKILK